jgi:hypothetical protein
MKLWLFVLATTTRLRNTSGLVISNFPSESEPVALRIWED